MAVVPASAAAAEREGPRQIVVYDDARVSDATATTTELARREGFDTAHVYEHALRGFAAELSDRQLEALRRDPRIAKIGRERNFTLDASQGAPMPNAHLVQGEQLPPGVERVGAARWAQSSQGGQPYALVEKASTKAVAVLDTGVDLDHPDLNVVSGKDCIDLGTAADDPHGHGTFVAGVIGAKNNGSGVVGVAPGTKIYAVRTHNKLKDGWESDVLCGLDWVAQRMKRVSDIGVANLSWGGPEETDQYAGGDEFPCLDVLYKAICKLEEAGITSVASAGNDDKRLEQYTPAAYDNVLAVTAMTDTDGKPGGSGPDANCNPDIEQDDAVPAFSNFAYSDTGWSSDGEHTIAAPGKCVLSTYPNSGPMLWDGTSFAAPHLSALVALCKGADNQPGPCAGMKAGHETIWHMWKLAQDHKQDKPSSGFDGDPVPDPPDPGFAGVRYYGYLAWAGY